MPRPPFGKKDFEPLELHDSEMMAAGKVLAVLQKSRGSHRNLEGFRREAIERFAEVGLIADVQAAQFSGHLDSTGWEITITGRCTESRFDPDRQVHEVTSGLLGLPSGVIKSNGLILPPTGHTHN